jgi:hypothetical protein
MYKSLLLAVLVTLSLVIPTAEAAPASSMLLPQFAPGQTYGTVFSILRSIKADGYDEYAGRNGGSADYRVISVGPDAWRMRLSWRYDGRNTGDAEVVLRNGGSTSCTLKPDGKEDCQPALDASGLVYNPLLWGLPPKTLAAGTTWRVEIKRAWELGGANGTEQVTVVSVDRATDTVVLMREGTAEGFFAEGEPTTRQLTRGGQTESVALIPGNSHWKGYTTIVKGVIFSDELLVTRDSMVRNRNGDQVHAGERWIMLLNAAPYPTFS